MTGNIDRPITASGKNSVKRRGPGQKIGLLVKAWVAGFLDEIAAEDHCGVFTGDDGNEIVVGVPTTGMADRHLYITERDHPRGQWILWGHQRRDSTVYRVWVGTMAHRVNT